MNRLLAEVIIDPPTGTGLPLSQTFPTIGSLISIILKNSLTIIGIILVATLIFGGFNYIISAGSSDSKKLAQAQAIVTDALIGFALVFLSYFVIQIIEVVTGINILNPTL